MSEALSIGKTITFSKKVYREKVDCERRSFIRACIVGTASSFVIGEPANALVKGNAPPPKKSASEKKLCTNGNLEECQEMAERLAFAKEEEERAKATPAKVAPLGSRYRDEESVQPVTGGVLAKLGDQVTTRYKVLKIGKRSYDGLSGEGTVVFSRGYGLEDDENKAGNKFFSFTIGDPDVIGALNDGVPGMQVGCQRRIAVLPQMGWRKPGQSCDGGPGGGGAGGELRTDYIVIPTATLVATETCFDKLKQPFPVSYAEERRMAQRFDQALIIEVELVKIGK